jgi:hypothetical protein
MGEKRYACMVLIGKPRGKGNTGRPDRRREKSFKMYV